MRLKEIRVDRYGPLGEFSGSTMGALSLIYGNNEAGKTLLIDAIVRLLFKKELGHSAKSFGNMSRVDESPEGYLVLELDGKEIKLDRDSSLNKYVSITPTDFRNIFVVRDSDLSMVNQEAYFTGVSEKLAGLQTSEINLVKRELQYQGRLTNSTSSADLANSLESGHIRGKVEKARDFIEEAGALAARLESAGYERLEQEVVETRAELAKHRRELELMRSAQLRNEIAQAETRLEELKQVEQGLEKLAPFNEEDSDAWTHGVRDLKRLKEERESALRDLATQQSKLGEFERSLADKSAGLQSMHKRSRRVEDLIEPRIYEYENLQRNRARRGSQRAFWKWGTGTAVLLLLVSLVGFMLQPSILFLGASGVFLIAAVVLGLQLILARIGDGKLAETWDELSGDAARLGFDTTSLKELLQTKNKFENQFEQTRQAVDGIKVNVEAQKSQIESLNKRLRENQGQMDEIERSIAGLKIKAGVAELDDYERALKQKEEYSGQKKYLVAMLIDTLGEAKEYEPMEYWGRQLASRMYDAAEGQDIPYDPHREKHLVEEIARLEGIEAETEEALRSGRQALRDLESKVNSAAIMDDVFCRTSGELKTLQQRLGEFIDAVTERRDDARHALSILEEVEFLEKAKVIGLFGEDKSVSTYFKRITGGLYHEVKFDPEAVEVSARTAEGQWVTANQLSGGTFDQLYLAIRLSIAESMFGDRRGFFILDDPFIKSDSERLENQIQLLKAVAASGWQVLYFSAKKEVFDLLRADIRKGDVKLFELGRAPATAVPPPDKPRPTPYPNDLFSDPRTY